MSDTQIPLRPNAQNSWLGFVAYRKRVKVADGIKIANQLTLRQEECPGLSKWGQCNLQALKSGRNHDRLGNFSVLAIPQFFFHLQWNWWKWLIFSFIPETQPYKILSRDGYTLSVYACNSRRKLKHMMFCQILCCTRTNMCVCVYPANCACLPSHISEEN